MCLTKMSQDKLGTTTLIDLQKRFHISRPQAVVLTKLADYPRLLVPAAVSAFFAWSDRGEPYYPLWLALPRPLGRMDLDKLAWAHKFGPTANSVRVGMMEDFKHGLLWLADFDHSNQHMQERALEIYREWAGFETTHWKQWRDLWRRSWTSR